MGSPAEDPRTDRPRALVTGASTGIGYELAKQFAEHGYDVVVVADEAAIDRAAAELGATGATVRPVRADLTDPAEVERVCSVTLADGPVDAVAINAGIGVHGPFASTALDDQLRVVDLNVRSAVHLAKRMVEHMSERGSGRILFTSSVAAAQPGPWQATYAASKAFLQSFAQALRVELDDTDIAVTSLMPGPTDTAYFDRADMRDTRMGQADKDDPATVARQGFEALLKDKDHVVPGSVKNRLMTAAGRLAPDPLKARAHGRMAEPGSGD